MPNIHLNDPIVGRIAGLHPELDAEPKRPEIKVNVTLSPTTNINDLFDKFTPTKEDMDKMFESQRRMAKEHEACIFAFALLNKVWKFYEVSFDVDNSDREKGIFRIDHYYKYFLHKNEARAFQKKYCGSFTKWNFKQLATMSDDEFEEISYTHGKNMNYELVKEWRQVIKEKYEFS